MQEDEIQATRDRWLRLDSWTRRQAFMLICKADPDSEGYPLKPLPCFESEFDPSEAFETCEELERIWCSGSHGNGNQPPSYFIEWARQKCSDVSWLEVGVSKKGDQSSDNPPSQSTRSGIREQSALATVAAMIAAWPGGTAKIPSGKDLEHAAQAVGVQVSDDTIRKVLEKACQLSTVLSQPK